VRKRTICSTPELIKRLRELPIKRATVKDAFQNLGYEIPAEFIKNQTRSRDGVPCVRSIECHSFTVCSSHGLTWCDRIGKTVRVMTPRESAILMGISPNWVLPTGSRNGQKYVASSVCVHLSRSIIQVATSIYTGGGLPDLVPIPFKDVVDRFGVLRETLRRSHRKRPRKSVEISDDDDSSCGMPDGWEHEGEEEGEEEDDEDGEEDGEGADEESSDTIEEEAGKEQVVELESTVVNVDNHHANSSMDIAMPIAVNIDTHLQTVSRLQALGSSFTTTNDLISAGAVYQSLASFLNVLNAMKSGRYDRQATRQTINTVVAVLKKLKEYIQKQNDFKTALDVADIILVLHSEMVM